jgi:hypothetical protein
VTRREIVVLWTQKSSAVFRMLAALFHTQVCCLFCNHQHRAGVLVEIWVQRKLRDRCKCFTMSSIEIASKTEQICHAFLFIFYKSQIFNWQLNAEQTVLYVSTTKLIITVFRIDNSWQCAPPLMEDRISSIIKHLKHINHPLLPIISI